MNDRKPVAVVTGANRGLGFETCRQLGRKGFKVVLTARDYARGERATASLKAEGLDVIFQQIDITDADAGRRLVSFIDNQLGYLDALVNNAGVFLDPMGSSEAGATSVFKARVVTLRESMETNVYGPLILAQALVPLMAGRGRIVNVSSGMGQLTEMNGGCPAYRLSKVALNALTRILADELKHTQIKVNSVCPGWVRTDMGGANAERSPEQGAETIVWLAMLPDDGPSGGFFRDKESIPW